MEQKKDLLGGLRKGVTIIALLGIAVACTPTPELRQVASDDAPFGSQEALSANDLEGTEWILDSYGPSETPVKGLAAPEVTIQFRDYKKMHGMAGCNTYAAQFEIDGHGLIHSGIEQTPFGCRNRAEWEQETEYLSALATADSIGLIDGLLAISYSGGQLRFLPRLAPPVPSLAGTHWRLISFKSGDSSQAILPGTVIAADFVDGKIIGTAGCNEYQGAYMTDAGSFTVWEIIKSVDPCPVDAASAQEKRYLDALHSASSFGLDDNILTINHDGGTLRFSKHPYANYRFATDWLTAIYGEMAGTHRQPGGTS